ncbi:MAG: alpha/beta hydrolase [Myxococcota bacterium]
MHPYEAGTKEHRVRANGLHHHVIEWPVERPRGTVLLCHGFLDIGWSYARLAPLLSAEGYRCLAFDWRGHGETEWVGAGGYYHFADYVLDLDRLTAALGERDLMTTTLHLVGHSMGGSACALFAGTVEGRIDTLTLMEGLGPPAMAPNIAPDRYRSFLQSVESQRTKTQTPIANLEEALRRMRVQNPKLDEDFGRFLAEKGTRPVAGGRVWGFDPLHRTSSPNRFDLDAFRHFLERNQRPTLLVFGEQGFRLGDEAERVALIKHRTIVEIADTGHMLHQLAPESVAEALLRHIEATS